LQKQAQLEKKLIELKCVYMRNLQDSNMDETDNAMEEYHEDTRHDLYEITTGKMYEDWKNAIVADDLEQARELNEHLIRCQNIPGNDPNATFKD
jgi:hypothetical protein